MYILINFNVIRSFSDFLAKDISYEASKDLVPFREPVDTSQLVLRATENLQNLSK